MTGSKLQLSNSFTVAKFRNKQPSRIAFINNGLAFLAQELLDIVWVAALAGASMGFGLRIVLETLMKTLIKSLVLLATLLTGTAYALPALQLGPEDAGDWTYNETTQTWETTDNPLTIIAYANAEAVYGGDGAYAWELSDTTQTVYLIVSAVPNQPDNMLDAFDVTITVDGESLSYIASGFGNPPIDDPNSLAGHDIFATYFEVYEFAFDRDSLGPIHNTQPGDTGSGKGYMESIMVQVNSMLAGVDGVHFDLFTVNGDGNWDPSSTTDKKLVYAFAPFSHDAEFVPEPATAALLLLGLLGFCFARRRQNS